MSDEISKPLRHYGVVRSDITLGQKFAQLGHAFGESAVLGIPPNNTTIACALEGSLLEIQVAINALKSRDFKIVQVVEIEGPLEGQLLAIGLEPTVDNRVRKILYHFKQCGESTPD